jgi:flavin reductase (DIM6/NTAB) family NADH-FMN oxidoreductase RutF
MFYEPAKKNHGLSSDPFKAIVAPRPIGWISSMSPRGEVNLAPYSFFNACSTEPPCVLFSSDGYKDSAANVEETGEFVCNLATWGLRAEVNLSSASLPRGVDEMREVGLAPAPSRLVRPPRVAKAPCALECKLLRIVRLEDLSGRRLDQHIVIGQVVGVHVDDRFLAQGRLDTSALQPIARCGYHDYAVVTELFQMVRPR